MARRTPVEVSRGHFRRTAACNRRRHHTDSSCRLTWHVLVRNRPCTCVKGSRWTQAKTKASTDNLQKPVAQLTVKVQASAIIIMMIPSPCPRVTHHDCLARCAVITMVELSRLTFHCRVKSLRRSTVPEIGCWEGEGDGLGVGEGESVVVMPSKPRRRWALEASGLRADSESGPETSAVRGKVCGSGGQGWKHKT
jgi:hypothetical protein